MAARCIVRVAVATQSIRALFAHEKPPVPDAEWDEAAYVDQRLLAYAEALGALALVRPMPPADADAAGAARPPTRISCPRTGDRIQVDLVDPDEGLRPDLRAALESALGRVFSDAHAWRRHLLPAYFERHRRWRAVAGGPIQH